MVKSGLAEMMLVIEAIPMQAATRMMAVGCKAPLFSHTAWPSSAAIAIPLTASKGPFSKGEAFSEVRPGVSVCSMSGFLVSMGKRSSH